MPSRLPASGPGKPGGHDRPATACSDPVRRQEAGRLVGDLVVDLEVAAAGLHAADRGEVAPAAGHGVQQQAEDGALRRAPQGGLAVVHASGDLLDQLEVAADDGDPLDREASASR
jgi:hypothetical protein